MVPEPQSCVVLIGESLGVAIEEVVADSAADGVLLSGDVLVSVDGEEVTSAMVLREILATRAVGDSVSIVVRRDGDEMSQEVVLGAKRAVEPLYIKAGLDLGRRGQEGGRGEKEHGDRCAAERHGIR